MESFDDLTFEFPEKDPKLRLRELILYIAERFQDAKYFGKVKLAKILYFSDMASYSMYGEPITGSAYLRWRLGPVPKGLDNILSEMEQGKLIAIQERRIVDYSQKRVIPLRPADVSIFSGRDIQILEDTIRELEGLTASDTSEKSHGIAWRITSPDEEIPYEASILSDRPLTQADIERAAELARLHGLE